MIGGNLKTVAQFAVNITNNKEGKMNNVIAQVQSVNQKAILAALMVAATAFAMVVVAYGVDSIVPGAHDAFHDMRHAIGMPCH